MNNLDLVFLKLNDNQLSGFIPPEFCNIYSVDLSNNEFCPEYPSCLTVEELGYQNTSQCNDDFCDLNLDGEINIIDVIIVINCIIGTDSCDYICMDYNDDQNIDVLDIILMVGIILGDE